MFHTNTGGGHSPPSVKSIYPHETLRTHQDPSLRFSLSMNYLVDCKACHKNLPKPKPPQRCLAPLWWFWRLCWLGEVGAVGLDDLLVPEEAVLAAAGKRAVAVVVLVNVDEAVALLSSRRSRRSPNRCSPTWRSPSGPCRPRWQAPSIDCKRFIALRCVHGTTQPAFYNRRTRGAATW